MWREIGLTVRAAISGWGDTLRLIAIMVTVTVCVAAVAVAHRWLAYR